ncbi:MAG: hypothetical protein KGP28_00760 [Bdellovibrionales bacterium]|nr:hypothetical protein [Bdellovibrionales bacterium]
MSLKIYGYHKGWDLDLNKTTASSPVGSPMPYPVCSVVGRTIRYQGTRDLAFRYRDMGTTVANDGKTNYTNAQVCGSLPKVEINIGSREIYLKLEGNSGSSIASWMLGAMPYEIRSQAYDFFQTVSKPADLDAAITDSNLQDSKARFSEIQLKSEQFLNSLPPESKAICSDNTYSNLVDRCLERPGFSPFALTDPALRLCTLAKASMLLNEASISGMIEFQIMSKAKASFQQHFGDTFLLSDRSVLWSALVKQATDDTSFWDCILDLKGRRKCAAEVISAVMGDGSWKVPKGSWWGEPTNQSPSKPRVGRQFFGFRLNPSVNPVSARLPFNYPSYSRISPPFIGGQPQILTLSSGIPAIIEKVIRYDICKQTRPGDPSPRCDETLIPNIPNNGVNYTW